MSTMAQSTGKSLQEDQPSHEYVSDEDRELSEEEHELLISIGNKFETNFTWFTSLDTIAKARLILVSLGYVSAAATAETSVINKVLDGCLDNSAMYDEDDERSDENLRDGWLRCIGVWFFMKSELTPTLDAVFGYEYDNLMLRLGENQLESTFPHITKSPCSPDGLDVSDFPDKWQDNEGYCLNVVVDFIRMKQNVMKKTLDLEVFIKSWDLEKLQITQMLLDPYLVACEKDAINIAKAAKPSDVGSHNNNIFWRHRKYSVLYEISKRFRKSLQFYLHQAQQFTMTQERQLDIPTIRRSRSKSNLTPPKPQSQRHHSSPPSGRKLKSLLPKEFRKSPLRMNLMQPMSHTNPSVPSVKSGIGFKSMGSGLSLKPVGRMFDVSANVRGKSGQTGISSALSVSSSLGALGGLNENLFDNVSLFEDEDDDDSGTGDVKMKSVHDKFEKGAGVSSVSHGSEMKNVSDANLRVSPSASGLKKNKSDLSESVLVVAPEMGAPESTNKNANVGNVSSRMTTGVLNELNDAVKGFNDKKDKKLKFRARVPKRVTIDIPGVPQQRISSGSSSTRMMLQNEYNLKLEQELAKMRLEYQKQLDLMRIHMQQNPISILNLEDRLDRQPNLNIRSSRRSPLRHDHGRRHLSRDRGLFDDASRRLQYKLEDHPVVKDISKIAPSIKFFGDAAKDGNIAVAVSKFVDFVIDWWSMYKDSLGPEYESVAVRRFIMYGLAGEAHRLVMREIQLTQGFDTFDDLCSWLLQAYGNNTYWQQLKKNVLSWQSSTCKTLDQVVPTFTALVSQYNTAVSYSKLPQPIKDKESFTEAESIHLLLRALPASTGKIIIDPESKYGPYDSLSLLHDILCKMARKAALMDYYGYSGQSAVTTGDFGIQKISMDDVEEKNLDINHIESSRDDIEINRISYKEKYNKDDRADFRNNRNYDSNWRGRGYNGGRNRNFDNRGRNRGRQRRNFADSIYGDLRTQQRKWKQEHIKRWENFDPHILNPKAVSKLRKLKKKCWLCNSCYHLKPHCNAPKMLVEHFEALKNRLQVRKITFSDRINIIDDKQWERETLSKIPELADQPTFRGFNCAGPMDESKYDVSEPLTNSSEILIVNKVGTYNVSESETNIANMRRDFANIDDPSLWLMDVDTWIPEIKNLASLPMVGDTACTGEVINDKLAWKYFADRIYKLKTPILCGSCDGKSVAKLSHHAFLSTHRALDGHIFTVRWVLYPNLSSPTLVGGKFIRAMGYEVGDPVPKKFVHLVNKPVPKDELAEIERMYTEHIHLKPDYTTLGQKMKRAANIISISKLTTIESELFSSKFGFVNDSSALVCGDFGVPAPKSGYFRDEMNSRRSHLALDLSFETSTCRILDDLSVKVDILDYDSIFY